MTIQPFISILLWVTILFGCTAVSAEEVPIIQKTKPTGTLPHYSASYHKEVIRHLEKSTGAKCTLLFEPKERPTFNYCVLQYVAEKKNIVVVSTIGAGSKPLKAPLKNYKFVEYQMVFTQDILNFDDKKIDDFLNNELKVDPNGRDVILLKVLPALTLSKRIVKYTHLYKTYLLAGHSLDISKPTDRPGLFDGAIVVDESAVGPMKRDGQLSVRFLTIIPLYPAETKYHQKVGAEKFFQIFKKAGLSIITNPRRAPFLTPKK